MKYREFGKLGWKVSEISFGSWAIGSDWGHVDESSAEKALNRAIDRGVNLIDTADVYGKGRSEKIIAKVLKNRTEQVYVITKAGRLLDPHVSEGYNRKNLTAFVEQSLKNLDTDSLDLVQLHCPPTEVYYRPEVFEAMDDLKAQGKIKHYGVSVEKIEEALKAIDYPGVETVQIIFNMFRQRPAELFFRQAAEKKTGIIARVPLASGLLTGKMNSGTMFSEDDHRRYNRNGEYFDKGETFSGVDFLTGLKAVEEVKKLNSSGYTLAQFALRWILMFDEVSCVIPGAKNPEQVMDNTAASEMEPLSEEVMAGIREIYRSYIMNPVHYMW